MDSCEIHCHIHGAQGTNPNDFCDPLTSCRATTRLVFAVLSKLSINDNYWMKIGTNT